MGRHSLHDEYILSHCENESVIEMANNLVASIMIIRAACHRLGVTPKKNADKCIYDDYIQSQTEDGVTLKTSTEMANECKCLPGTIFNACTRLGIRVKQRPQKKHIEPVKIAEDPLVRGMEVKQRIEHMNRDPSILYDVLHEIGKIEVEKPVRNRPPTEYTQGSSYLKLLEKYAS